MIEVLILAIFVIVVLVATVWFLIIEQTKERELWRDERRFLTDRAIASHVGDVVALDRIDQKGKADPTPEREHVPNNPLGI